MSSHREAPEISKDPVADNTDLYAFVSPDRPDTVTLIANFIPLQGADGGPNFYEFGDDVLYSINIDNNGDGKADVSYQFNFTTQVRNPDTFLYNTGPIQSLDRRELEPAAVLHAAPGDQERLARCSGTGMSCPPCNIGPLSTPDYPSLAAAAVHSMAGGRRVFAGQRAEGFYVDLGATFDLLDPRPLANLHATFGLTNLPTRQGPAVNSTRFVNVHSIALQVPKTDLTAGGKAPTDATKSSSVIGVWSSTSRRKVNIRKGDGTSTQSGPYVQVSRLGNPLFNEVIVPMVEKDNWNAAAADQRQVLREVRREPRGGQPAAGALPGRLPAPGRAQRDRQAAGRPRGDPADRHPEPG